MDKTIPFVLILAVLFAGCVDNGSTGPIKVEASPEEKLSVVEANNRFALELFEKWDGDENVFFSPYSISTALAMTYEGARGQTATEMQSVLHFPEDAQARRNGFASTIGSINDGSGDYELSTANALWPHKGYPFLEEYIQTVEDYYGGKTTALDYVGETEKSRQTINSWVKSQTKDKIKELIPPGVITGITRLVLTNAIYFKGKWVNQFDKSDTRDADFTTGSGEVTQVPTMHLKNDFRYAENGELQMLELPYKGDRLSMLVFLPKEGDYSFRDFSSEGFSEMKKDMFEREVRVYLPKFKFETKYFMKETLSEMGMPTAFSMNADLSGMDGTMMLFIQSVIHQAFVEVDEEGTEAAAATAVVVGLKAAPERPLEFRADHPFLFFIQDNETGAILFMGKVNDPSQ